MGENYWIGGAPAVAQKTTVQITNYDATTTYMITVGGIIISVPGSGGSDTTVATALAAAWNASTHPYATPVTAASLTDTITFTADNAGVPFIITSAVSGGSGTIGAATASVASSGPNDYSTAANWSLGAIPANSDNVYIRNIIIPVLWGLAQSGVAPSLLLIEQTFTGRLGLPYQKFTISNGNYDSTVPEYRATYLATGAAVVRIGENYSSAQTAGSSLVKVDTGTTNTAWLIYASGTSDDGLPAIRVKNTNSSSTLKIYAGGVGVCWELPTESGQFSEIDIYGSVTTQGAPLVNVGAGVTLGKMNAESGTAILKNVPTTVTCEAGSTVTLASPAGGTITTLEMRGTVQMAGTYAVTNLKG